VSCLFFFSSRRRHTRSKRDWSSDVCSSDLWRSPLVKTVRTTFALTLSLGLAALATGCAGAPDENQIVELEHAQESEDAAVEEARSEERRVGKERRSGGRTEQETNKALVRAR